MTASPTLVTKGLTVSYGALRALDNVSVSVAHGEVVSLIGPNGAGKTTLLNAISGLLRIAAGSISLSGRDVSSEPCHRRSVAGLRRTFQHARLSDDLTAIENVLLGASVIDYPRSLLGEWLRFPTYMSRLSAQRRNALDLLDMFSLADVADVLTGNLSFGRKKLVDLARALMTSPRLLLLDEPTAGLTDVEVETLIRVIGRVRNDTATLLVAHHMGFVSKVANRVVCLVAGEIISQGTPREVQADPRVLSAYMGIS